MIILISVVLLLVATTVMYLQLPKFGKAPGGQRLESIQKSSNFKDGKFENIHLTPMITEGHSAMKITWGFFFGRFPRTTPTDTIPSKKTNLKNLPINENVLVWFGHSSYFMQVDGKKILVDPVFSGAAAPFSFSVKAFFTRKSLRSFLIANLLCALHK